MLERIGVIIDVIIVVVGVGEKIIFLAHYIGLADIHPRQESQLRLLDLEYVFGVITQVLALLITQIGVCILVANDLYRLVHPHGTVVGGYNHLAFLFRDTATMMGVDVPNIVWFLLIAIPVFFLVSPMRRYSGKTAAAITLTLLIFGVHVFWFSQSQLYVLHKNYFDFMALTACILGPTLIVTWSNSAYPAIERKIGDRLADGRPSKGATL